ncbi:uncharacterized protein LOC131164872 [Malania oleifera]|uniref:uncharacterized protein LOC131164872 n=1 Tax=Malania oleifera TaxID=397392 RepID=UPI0025ADA58C|nr:uncharacterized protein LOC131164872 [Malania oleifera]XP_057978378.1 uncharacterized protein LOC131164872 [Malania oleifera]
MPKYMDLQEENFNFASVPDNLPSTSSSATELTFSPSLPTRPSSSGPFHDIHSCIDPLSSNSRNQDMQSLRGASFASSDMLLTGVVRGPSNYKWLSDCKRLGHISTSTETSSSSPSSYVHGYDNYYSKNEGRFKEFGGGHICSVHVPSSNDISSSSPCSCAPGCGIDCPEQKEMLEKYGGGQEIPVSPTLASLTTNTIRNYDVYIGFHGTKPSLLRFADWLRAEFEVQGVTCFVVDRARSRDCMKLLNSGKAMNVSTFGVILITKKSFKNPYTIEELQLFSSKKKLVPIFFNLRASDCIVTDIVEKRGKLWEKHGGELWMLYGGSENEWKEAVDGLFQANECNLEAHEGTWRDCIFNTVTLLAVRLGRRSVVKKLTKWREKVEKEEFPLPRNGNFIGRKKELSELELILFGNFSGDSERQYFEIKERDLAISGNKNSSKDKQMRELQISSGQKKGKEPIVWKESEKEIELEGFPFFQRQNQSLVPIHDCRYRRRKKSRKFLYGKGIACVSGYSGIGKTELLLEFAYRFQQRYKMVFWVGGESRYIRHNYLNLHSLLEVDVGIEGCLGKNRTRSFEEQEEAAISRVRKEFMRNIPFLVVIDDLESEKDWWDNKLIMDLLPRFGSETHVLISTCLPRVMNIEPLRLSYLTEAETMSLMHGNPEDYPSTEIDVLRIIEENLGKLTLGLAIVGAILSELPINPSRLLDIIRKMPLKDLTWSGREGQSLGQNTFLLKLLEVCFLIFDHADGPRSLASRMIEVSGWFAPAAIPISLLALAAKKMPEKHRGTRLWKRILHSMTHGVTSSYTKRSEAEAASILSRFNIARSSTRREHLQFNKLIRLYAQKRGAKAAAEAVVQAAIRHGSISQHTEHMWAVCFILFGFGNESRVVEIKVSELLFLVKKVILPLAIRTFIAFSRCSAAVELLRQCTDALEAADEAFVAPAGRWLDKSLCWKPTQTKARLNPYLWQQLALSRATILETSANLMLQGGHFDIGDDLIRKALFIRTSIYGENHPDAMSAHTTLSRLLELLENVQRDTSL